MKRQFIHVKNLRYLLFVLPEYIYTECHIRSVLEQSMQLQKQYRSVEKTITDGVGRDKK